MIQMLLMALMEFIDFGTCIIYLRERLSLFSGGMICNLINTNPGSPFLSFMCRSVFGVWKSPNECPCSGVPHLMLRLETDILDTGAFFHFFFLGLITLLGYTARLQHHPILSVSRVKQRVKNRAPHRSICCI